ncbi:hypothetical protein AAVH_42253 [Aphelenchoides avenae]|nr:hypothetical protein AAVH_42253 [Aphelenchus avenae]
MRLTSACVSSGLLSARLTNGTTEISLPISLPTDYNIHYELNLCELVDYVFRQRSQVGFIYAGARRISGCEEAVDVLSKIKDMPEEYSATLMLSGVGLSDMQKRKLSDETDDDGEPACKKRRVNQSAIDYVFKAGASKDICVMRREFPKKALKRSMAHILS